MAQRRRSHLRSRLRLGINDLAFVRDTVFPARVKWYDIGLNLRLPVDMLDAIRNERGDDGDHLREMLKHWLKGELPAPTRKALVDALKIPAVGEAQLATEVEQKLKHHCLNWTALRSSSTHKAWWLPSGCSWLRAHCMFWAILCILVITLVCALALFGNFGYSRNLPPLIKHFVGRKRDLDNILQLVDFTNPNARVIGIFGPPGFGKSTLAIHVCHHIQKNGVLVNYVNLLEVSSLESLAEKILHNVKISVKHVTVERVIAWGRGLSYSTLVVLDNCDDMLHNYKEELQSVILRLVDSSQHVKILITSRQQIMYLNDFKSYQLNELTTEASCNLLCNLTDKIDTAQCESVIKLTGSVPLALRVVGKLVDQPNSPDVSKIINRLQKQLMPTLSPKMLLRVEEQVNACIAVSYHYLNPQVRAIGRYIANFPGSFDEEAAHKILHYSCPKICHTGCTISEALDELVLRSLLEYDQQTNRYNFHQLIKGFLTQKEIRNRGSAEKSKFIVGFQWYFTGVLKSLANNYVRNYVKVLHSLDAEQHNILHLLKNFYIASAMNTTVSISTVMAVHHAIRNDVKLIQCRFTTKQLIGPINAITIYLEDNIEAILKEISTVLYTDVYASYVIQLAISQSEVYNVHRAVETLEARVDIMDKLDSKVPGQVTFAYTSFFYVLCDFYSILQLDNQVKECHEKILRKTEELTDCLPGFCSYCHIGTAYYRLGKHEKTIHFLDLCLSSQRKDLDILTQAYILSTLRLACIHEGNAKVQELTEEIVNLFPSLMKVPPIMIRNFQHIEEIIHVYREGGKFEEANILEEKQIMAMLATGSYPDKIFLKAHKLAQSQYNNENYSRVISLGNSALTAWENTPKELQKHFILLYFKILLLIGKAKYYSKMTSLEYFEKIINEFETYYGDERKTLYQACWYAGIIYKTCIKVLAVDIKDLVVVSVKAILTTDDLEQILHWITDIKPQAEDTHTPRKVSEEVMIYDSKGMTLLTDYVLHHKFLMTSWLLGTVATAARTVINLIVCNRYYVKYVLMCFWMYYKLLILSRIIDSLFQTLLCLIILALFPFILLDIFISYSIIYIQSSAEDNEINYILIRNIPSAPLEVLCILSKHLILFVLSALRFTLKPCELLFNICDFIAYMYTYY